MDITRVKKYKGQDWSRLSNKRCKQHKDQEDQVRDWSRFPGGVVGEISDNLSLYDYLCFSNVCKSWRSYQEETLHCDRSRGRGFPWLVMSKETETETITCISLLEKNKLCQLEMTNSSGGLFWGCIQDWLIITKPLVEVSVGIIKIRMSLMNPFTQSEVVLPDSYNINNKLVFSGDPGVKLDSLGDCVMFLGRNCSRCYSAKELWGGDDMGNCIYFTNGCALRRDMHMEKEFSCSLEKDDWGIFRLNSEGGSEGFSYLAKQGKRPPVWLTAPLWWYFNEFRP
ncbi:hypothetical protein LWI29_003317 [Acer saccharum]|uniref:DUF295 domain-containing protein n=1 Tax=Acer saccharum TaxID=4024 RepID=A0AA39SXF1_ACESA|nr:hypothetical protein LWI29_003317 [Acer saccharum]